MYNMFFGLNIQVQWYNIIGKIEKNNIDRVYDM